MASTTCTQKDALTDSHPAFAAATAQGIRICTNCQRLCAGNIR